MSFGSSSETFGIEILFGLGILASLPILFGLTFLLQRIVGIRSGWFTLLFVTLIYLGTLLGTSFYLDSVGTTISAIVTQKDDRIDFRKEGDWRHNFYLHVQYLTDGRETASLFRTTEAHFDSIPNGGQVDVRTVSINGWFSLARSADQSTWTWIPWKWLALALVLLTLVWVAWKLLQFVWGRWLVLLVVLLLISTPFALKYQAWQRSENPALTPLRALGVIQEVRRVTTIDPMPSDGSDGPDWQTQIDVAQLYDIVVIRYTPAGYKEPIFGVDAVDASERSLTPNASIEIAYAADAPRQVRLLGATRFHHIRNPLEWLKQQMIGMSLLLLVFSAGVWLPWLWRKIR